MSIRGGFDRLTKELDALTYNSRSVLNALIRSTVASGTSQGYTVTRAGIKLTLSRVDIYRLYQFYQAWAVNDFATVPVPASSTGGRIFSFDEIRVELLADVRIRLVYDLHLAAVRPHGLGAGEHIDDVGLSCLLG